MNQKLKQDDYVTDKSVNPSRTTENHLERDIFQVRMQEKVETIWLFDTRAEAHVMPKHVWGTVERAHTANNKSNAERSKWTRSWSHG